MTVESPVTILNTANGKMLYLKCGICGASIKIGKMGAEKTCTHTFTLAQRKLGEMVGLFQKEDA